MKKFASLLTVSTMCLSMLSGCVSAPADSTSGTTSGTNTNGNSSEATVTLPVSLGFGNMQQTITYNQSTPLTLSDGTVITQGMIKPVWQYLEDQFNIDFVDITIQDAKSVDLIATAATTNFTEAVIYGGTSIAESLMSYGAEGKFVSLSDQLEAGNLPNFQAYLEENPAIESAITAYDGNIYYIPYVAEIGTAARQYIIRGSWPEILLDSESATYSTNTFNTFYEPFYDGTNERQLVSEPMAGVYITKKTTDNIIEIQNSLSVKNGETLTKALIDYINNNYDYANPSELYVGEKAAYDMDELVALFRCIKANPELLTDGTADEVWPYFVREAKLREYLLRFATHYGGVQTHGTDSSNSTFALDENGELYYTYEQDDLFEVLTYLSAMNAEGLIYTDMYDVSITNDFRTILYGTDDSDSPSYGFMTYDWIASSTTPSLNEDTTVVLPPVGLVNGTWQYYVGNTRAIQAHGWSISAASTDEQVAKACELFDYFFTEEGSLLQNYGLPMDVNTDDTYVGPDGVTYPQFSDWMIEKSNELANGDMSTLLRNWLGSLLYIGYQKEIGFEYQTTSDQGFTSWELANNSTINYPNYSGSGLDGDNENYYYLLPTVYSLTSRQTETLATETTIDNSSTSVVREYIFNTIRYHALGGAPSGTSYASSLADYNAFFESVGSDTYIDVYKTAFNAMSGN